MRLGRRTGARATLGLLLVVAVVAPGCGAAEKGAGPGPDTPPTVATAAAASPSPVTGKTATLTALGADDGGEGNLTYTWATTGTPPAAVSFGANGTNAAREVVATFAAAGSYGLRVTIADAGGRTVTSSVPVTVNQTLTTVAVSPASASVAIGATRQLVAAASDQFGAALSTQPTFAWTVSGGGTISEAGLFTADATAGGPYTITATGGGKSGTASVTVTSDGTRYSSETGRDHGSVYFDLSSPPPYDYFIGVWTHVQAGMGSGGKGNDYPFAVFCTEGEVSFVSGNFGAPWDYNANIMLFDTSGKYIADYTTRYVPSSEAADRDWVYVGWHFQRVGDDTSVTQYVKFVGSSNLVDDVVTETVPGHWTPTQVLVGTDPPRWPGTPMYVMYARVYAMDTPPTAAQVNAISTHSGTPDSSAWADWPLEGADPSDVSGHGRNLTVVGAVGTGPAGPPQLP